MKISNMKYVTEEQYLAMQHLSILEANTLLSEKSRNDIKIILDMVGFGTDLIRIKGN